MSIKKAVVSLSIAIAGCCLSTSDAIAAYFSPMTDYTRSEWDNTVNDGGFVEELNVSSYIGDGGGAFYELELNDIQPPDIVKSTEQAQFLWDNNAEVDFSLSLDNGKLTYEVGGEKLISEQVIDDIDINGMMLIADSTEGSSVSLENLKFDGSDRSMEYLLSKDSSETDFLKITGLNEDFTFSGTQVFSWDGESPINSELGYEIKVGNFQTLASTANANLQQEIPEPSTISFFSLLAIAAGVKVRKK